MLYNQLTESELERAVYIDPTNAAAAAEMLRGAPERMEEHADALAEAEAELAIVNKNHESEIAELEAEAKGKDLDIEAGDTVITNLTAERDDAITHVKEVMLENVAANKRIKSLAFAATEHAKEIARTYKQLAAANARIAELTCAEDLV